MDASTESRLVALKAARDRHRDEIRQIDLETGRIVADLDASGDDYNKSAIGRLLGVSHTQVKNLMRAAETAPVQTIPADRVPVMDNVVAGAYVRDRGARIVRSISGFEESDVLYASGLDPRVFTEARYGGGDWIRVPAMLWLLDSGEWLGVSEATVGYLGTGPRYAEQALLEAGVDASAAAEIPRWRFCDAVDISNPNTWEKSVYWPRQDMGIPDLSDDRMVVRFGEGRPRLRYGNRIPLPGDDRRDPAHPEKTRLEAWINFLNDPPEWASGNRVARVFVNRGFAAAQGFELRDPLLSPSRPPVVVIEQGLVQLWGYFFRSFDRTEILPPGAYEALDIAGVYPPAVIAEHDARAGTPWGRFVNRFIGSTRDLPPFIDISATGDVRLDYTPYRA